MDSLQNVKVIYSDSKELEIQNGLVVPQGSEVTSGIFVFTKWPSNSVSLAAFKQLFGIRKKKFAEVVEEEEDKKEELKEEESEIEESDKSEDETEAEEEED